MFHYDYHPVFLVGFDIFDKNITKNNFVSPIRVFIKFLNKFLYLLLSNDILYVSLRRDKLGPLNEILLNIYIVINEM